MSTEPLERRNVLSMDREICRLRRVEEKYKAENDSLKAKLADTEKKLKSCDNARVLATKLLCEAEGCKRALRKQIEKLKDELREE